MRGLVVLVAAIILAASGCAVPEAVPAGDAPAPVIDPATAATRPAPKPATKPATKPGTKVTRVVAGDTVELVTGQRVRLIGVDSPARGECGYESARDHLRELIGSHPVSLVAVLRRAARDSDGRLLRYVVVAGKDVGLVQIQAGYAAARSDGYGSHPKQSAYAAADSKATSKGCTSKPPRPTTKPSKPGSSPGPEVPVDGFANCAEARASGVPLPLTPGDPGWNPRLDGDDDGKACEPEQ